MANKRSASSSSSSGPGAGKRPTPKRTPPAPTKRTTPKGGGPAPTRRTPPKETARYTPPIPKSQKVSPVWVPILMFGCLLLGMAMIVANYVSLLPGSPKNGWLLGGLGLITAGFVTATKYY